MLGKTFIPYPNKLFTKWSEMSLIIRQLRRKEDYEPVRFSDFPEDGLEKVDSFDNLELYAYEGGSNPIAENKVYSSELYNDDLNKAPINVLVNEDGDLKKDRRNIAKQLYDNFGAGRYNVFTFGGNPPRDPVFQNLVIRERSESKNNG